MPIKAVLFDIDGTLVDSNELHITAWAEAFEEIGESFERQVIHDQLGKGADMLVPTLLPHIEENKQSALSDRRGEIFKEKYLSQVRPFPGAKDLLGHVHRQGRKVVLASSSSPDELNHYLDLLGARDLAAATTSSGDVEKTKPAPDIFSTALGKLDGIAPDEALVLGDTPYDIEAARKCGIATVAVRSGGFPDEVLTEAGAIAIYDDVAALLAGYDASPLNR